MYTKSVYFNLFITTCFSDFTKYIFTGHLQGDVAIYLLFIFVIVIIVSAILTLRKILRRRLDYDDEGL